jgi:hypothetical protein
MLDPTIVAAGFVLVLAVAVGLIAHESAHAAVLRLAGVEHSVSYFPGRHDGVVALLTTRPWAVVRPRPTGRESPWSLRLAALAPALLAAPVFGLGFAGHLTAETPLAAAAAIGWLACAVPSPQDFSVAVHAPRLLERSRRADATPYSRAD